MNCDLCGTDREDLAHFILECPRLEGHRDRNLIGLIGGTGDRIDRVGNLLFNKANIEKAKKMLGTLWKERNFLLIKNSRESHQQVKNQQGRVIKKKRTNIKLSMRKGVGIKGGKCLGNNTTQGVAVDRLVGR